MMNYFLSDEDLKKALDKERDFLFSAIGKALHELEHKFLILFDVGIAKRNPTNKKRSKKMSEDEPRATRPFDEVLADMIDYILQSEDHDLILMVDELSDSAKEEVEKKEILTKKLRQSYTRAKELLKQYDEDKKGEKETA